MIVQKRWNFGLGTIFSLIVVYFIFLYSREKNWVLLALASKWYLIIVGSLIVLFIGIIFLIILFSLLLLLFATIKMKNYAKADKKQNSKKYIDAEYEVKK